jgi:hypothetical protein
VQRFIHGARGTPAEFADNVVTAVEHRKWLADKLDSTTGPTNAIVAIDPANTRASLPKGRGLDGLA